MPRSRAWVPCRARARRPQLRDRAEADRLGRGGEHLGAVERRLPAGRDPAPKADGERQPPRRRLDAGERYAATVTTNCGEFELDVEAAPRTAASFVELARDGFFEQTVFHRIVPGFVIQGGDPTGTGKGGPGYKTVDRPPRGAQYTKGVVAMAKAGDERPGTGGSQFFVVTAPDAGLPPDYALLGRVGEGLAVVDRIAQLGDTASGQAGTPLEPVVVEKVTVSGP